MTKPHGSNPRQVHEARGKRATIERAERHEAKRARRAVFSDIYRRNGWNGVESRSGPGSGRAATELVAGDILALIDEFDVQSVVDAACGDSFWMPELPGYVGIDLAPEAVELARARHPDRDYRVGDIADGIPTGDLVIFRDAMQHLPLAAGVAALDAIRSSEARLLLASTFVGGMNVDVAAGDAYSPDLSAPPFDLGAPARLIFDGYGYDRPAAIRDPRKHLGLWLL